MLSSPSKFNSAALCTKKTEQVSHLDPSSLSQQIRSATSCAICSNQHLRSSVTVLCPTSDPGECQGCDFFLSFFFFSPPSTLGKPGMIVKMTAGVRNWYAKPRCLRWVHKTKNSHGKKCAWLIRCAAARSVRAGASATDKQTRTPGSRRTAFTHLTAKSWTRTTGKSGKSRSNTGQSLVSLLCLTVISFKFTCPAAYFFLGKSQKGWLVCDWSLFSLWVWGLESLLTKFAVWPTVTASSLRTCRSDLSPARKQKQSSLSFQRAHSKACLNSIKQDSCHYSPSWIQCAAVDSHSSDTPPNPWTPPTDSVIGTGARRSP